MNKNASVTENGTRLAIELGINIKLNIQGLGQNLSSKFIGLESPQYIIVKIPAAVSHSTIVQTLVPNTRVVVRYVYNGTVFGFNTHILQAFFVPMYVLFLAFPKSITEQNIREHQRIACIFPAHVTVDGHLIEGSITDISPNGCNWRTKKDLLPEQYTLFDDLNKKITVNLTLLGTNEKLVLDGKGKNIRKDGSVIEVGIEFNNKEHTDMKKLYSFLNSLEYTI